MIMKFQEWTPELKKNAWVAEGASVIGRVKYGRRLSRMVWLCGTR